MSKLINNIGTRPASAYAPAGPDPVRLAGLVAPAVERIGALAAEEIENSADEFERAARVIADDLRRQAAELRQQTIVAGAKVSAFCATSTAVIETIGGLQDKLSARADNGARRAAEPAQDEEPAQDGEAEGIPKFLRAGPLDPEQVARRRDEA